MSSRGASYMAWRKGFFRGWVVVSLVWVTFVALITYEDIANPYFGNRGVYYKKGVSDPLVIEEYSTAYRDLEYGTPELTAEAIVLRHPSHFSPAALAAARYRPERRGIQVDLNGQIV